MAINRRNKKFVAVVTVTAVLHIVVLFAIGSLVIFSAIRPTEPEFEAPVPLVPIEPERLTMQANMEQMRQSSSRPQPQQRITVQIPQMANIQNVELNVAPPVMGNVSVGAGSQGGMGRIGGSGGIGMGMRQVSFLGVQAAGERVAIIVDCSNHMLIDEKGGLHAFRLVKDEVLQVIKNLDSGVVFNVYLFSGRTVNRFSEYMVTATPASIEAVREWIAPINEDVNARGARRNNFEPEDEYFSGHSYANFMRALHAAFEDHAEAVFMIAATWSNIRQHIDDLSEGEQRSVQRDRERRARDLERRQRQWTERDQELWDAYQRDHVEPMRRRAQELWDAENARRAARGQPHRVVVGNHIETVIRENNLRDALPPRPPRPPRMGSTMRNYTVDEIIRRFQREMIREIYREQRREVPSVNIILFGEGEEAEENYRRLARASRSGVVRVIPSLAELQAAAESSREHRENPGRM